MRPSTPVYLISLYDLHHHIDQHETAATASSRDQRRFLDSGGYEIGTTSDSWHSDISPGSKPWTPELYVMTARTHGRPSDTLVSFDRPELSLGEQVQQGMALFAEVDLAGVARDLLVHPNGATPEAVTDAVAYFAPDIDILGLTEKDIGYPWFLGAAFIRELRCRLDARLGRYLPIHVFGCLDPKTLPHLFFAGADIFDGLAWMRYYFRDGHAFYAKEIEYDGPPATLLDPGSGARFLLAHNIEELSKLQADLQYSVSAGDPSLFTDCLDALLGLEEAQSLVSDPSPAVPGEGAERHNGR